MLNVVPGTHSTNISHCFGYQEEWVEFAEVERLGPEQASGVVQFN